MNDKKLYKILDNNYKLISSSMYPQNVISNLISDISTDNKEYTKYLKYAYKWIQNSKLLVGVLPR